VFFGTAVPLDGDIQSLLGLNLELDPLIEHCLFQRCRRCRGLLQLSSVDAAQIRVQLKGFLQVALFGIEGLGLRNRRSHPGLPLADHAQLLLELVQLLYLRSFISQTLNDLFQLLPLLAIDCQFLKRRLEFLSRCIENGSSSLLLQAGLFKARDLSDNRDLSTLRRSGTGSYWACEGHGGN
jgi:hypothetical protein